MSLAHWLGESWSWLAAGSTLILGLAALAVVVGREPALRQRLAQLGVVSCLGWLVLAALPMPRPFAMRAAVDASSVATPDLGSASIQQGPRLESLPTEPPAPVVMGPHTTELRDPRAGMSPTKRLALAYLAGSALQALWLAYGWLRLRRRLRRATEPDHEVQELAAEVAAAAGVRFTLHVGLLGSGACTFGWRPARVLVPRDLCRPAARGELLAVLRHEAVHVARHDALGQALVATARVVLWAHPLYWWLRRAARFAAELVADDQAARACDPCTYTRHLLRVAERSPRRGELLAPTICNRQSEFYRRMNMLLHRTHALATHCSSRQRIASVTLALATTALAAALWGTGPLPGQAPAQPAPETKGTLGVLLQDPQLYENIVKTIEQVKRGVGDASGESGVVGGLQGQDPAPPKPKSDGVPFLRDLPLLAHLFKTSAQGGRTPNPASEPEPSAHRTAQDRRLAEIQKRVEDYLEKARGAVPAPTAGSTQEPSAARPARKEIEEHYLAEARKLFEGFLRETKDAPDAGPAPGWHPEVVSMNVDLVEVKPGDSFASLVKRYARSTEDLQWILRLNPELAADTLRVGQKIKVPRRQPSPQPGESPALGMDAARLATELVDLHVEWRMAAEDVARLEPLVAGGLASSGELAKASAKRDAAARKRTLLAKLARGEMRALQAELEVLEVRSANAPHGAQVESEAHRLRLRTRIEVLDAALKDPEPAKQ